MSKRGRRKRESPGWPSLKHRRITWKKEKFLEITGGCEMRAARRRERETNWKHAEMAARQRHHWWVMRDQDFETCRQLTSGNSRLGWIIHSNGGLICQFNSLVNGHNTVSLNEGNTRSHSATSVTHSRRVEKTLKKVTLSEQCCTQSPQVLQLTSTGGN